MKLLLAIMGAVVMLALAASSSAAAPVWNATPYTDAEIEYDIRLAGDYWDKQEYLAGPGCTYTYMADMSNDYSAWGDSSVCSIWLSRVSWANLSTVERCHLIVHEVGHLVGNEHVEDPTNVMYGGSLANMVVPQCEPGYVLATPKRVQRKKRCNRRISHAHGAGRSTTAPRRKTCTRRRANRAVV